MAQRKNRNWIGYNKNDQVLITVFLYNLYIFVWTSHSDLTYIYLDPNEMSGQSYLCTCPQTILLSDKEDGICTLLTHR